MSDYIIRATAADGMIRAFAATTRDMVEDACYIDGCSEDGTRRFEAILQFRPDYSAGLDVAPDYE